MAKVVLPGDVLPAPSTSSAAKPTQSRPGPGSFVAPSGSLSASLAGVLSGSGGTQVSRPQPASSQGAVTTNALPRVGSVVLLRVQRTQQRAATGSIVAVSPPPASSSQQANDDSSSKLLPTAELWPCTLRREDIRATEKDRVRVADSVRPGDIVRADVIGLGDQQSGFYVSTARNELGVVVAHSGTTGRPLIPLSWREMGDSEDGGARELRKVAKP